MRSGFRGISTTRRSIEVSGRPVSGGGALPAAAAESRATRSTSTRRSSTAVDECARAGAGRRARLPARRARDPRSGGGAAQAPSPTDRDPAALRAAVGAAIRSGCSSRTRAGASCSRPTSPRPRSPCRASASSSTRGSRAIKRYSYRNKVEQLQVERISQAAAKQRAGRCGRVAAGVCIRLYDEEDFARRPAYTDPEMLRSSLASVILRMKSLGLGAVEDFPFIDPPAARAIADGYALLAELGAVDDGRELTEIGRQLARLPVDPRIGRMVLAAKEEARARRGAGHRGGALGPGPARAAARARAGRRRGAEAGSPTRSSDFLSGSSSCGGSSRTGCTTNPIASCTQACRDHFLSFTRMREWRDIHSQLKELVAELGWKAGRDQRRTPTSTRRVHRALLTGLLGNVGLRTEEGELPRRARHQVLGPSRVGARQEGAALDRRRRADGDDPPLRPHRRRHRARVAGAARRAPAQAVAERAALGEEAGRGGGAGARDALRAAGLRSTGGCSTGRSTG